MPVFAQYNFDDTGSTIEDSATENGNQLGGYFNGAAASGGQVVLDGVDDIAKIYPSPTFQMDRGTLDIQFTTSSTAAHCTQTLLSRDSVGVTDGGYHIDLLATGAVQIVHESPAGTQTFGTPSGFVAPGQDVKLTYSWDEVSGGRLQIENLTTGDTFDAPVPAGLTMDQSAAGNSQPWIIGAGQSLSDPGMLNNLNQPFAGSVESFTLSDTVDNLIDPPIRDGWVDGTSGNDLIDITYTGDPDGDRIDANDAILPGDDPNDDRVRAGDGDDTVLAGQGDDLVYGGAGNDLIFGGPGNDTLHGDAGNDILFGGNGRDEVYGGEGNDLIDTSGGGILPLPDIGYPGVYPADSAPTNDLDTVYGGAGDDTIRTGDDVDLIYGGSGNDNIDGGIDNDSIYGGAGNDTVIGGEGADLIHAGDGNDLVYGGLPDGVLDGLNIPDATDLRPENGIDTIYGGAGDDTIYGMDDNDSIFGGIGNDLLFGGIDNDTLFGDAGNDTLTGGEGLDNMSGGDDRDTFIVNNASDGYGDVIDGNEGGDDYDTLDLRGTGPLQIDYDPTNRENGTVNFLDTDGVITGSLVFTNIENIIPCFTPGTLIATPRGEVPVESLRPGDRVITRDNGIQEIRWTGFKDITWRDLTVNPHLKPILVRQGSLGNGLPERDMMVSPNHRLLVTNDRTALYFDEHEVLVAAKHLVSGKGVHEVDSIGTTYIHFMFDRHEVVLSNGAWTESFQPGDYTLKGMGNAQRNEIYELFPELKTEEGLEGYGAARRTLKKHEARLLMR